MSLFVNYNDSRFIDIAQKIFEEQFRRDPKLKVQLDNRRKKLMYDDVVYNISHLMTAVYFSDEKIFQNYALWVYDLLCNLMKDFDRDRIMQMMVDHYTITAEVLEADAKEMFSEKELEKAVDYLKIAIKVTKEAVTNIELSDSFEKGKYKKLRKEYLDALLKSQTTEAYRIIEDARTSGVSLVDIYEEVLSKVLYEVGELWHKSIITVDKEHYATSITQSIMSRFYDEIFNRPRKSKTLLSCAVGSELHEIGVRMLSDMFEYHGWDTIYLGAALPEAAILNAIKEHQPDLVALSVTMQPYLTECESVVLSIRKNFPAIKIAVGGQAFIPTERLWEKWPIDFYSKKAIDLIEWAKENI